MAQALFIGVSAVLIGVQAVERLKNPTPLGDATVGIVVMLLSLGLTVALLMVQARVVRLTGSTAVRADSLHYRSDLLLNSSILLALILAGFGWHRLDAIFGIAIAFYILWSALTIARESVAVLMDAELSVEITERMHLLACAVPGALGAHDLRTRISGTRWFVQLHLELPNEMPLSQVHELCEQVETAIQTEFPQAEVLVHPDPQSVLPASA